MFADLIHNLALLVALSVISSFLVKHWPAHTRTGALLQGSLFGAAAVIGMMRPLVLGPGLIFDGRSIVVSLCAYFFGPWSAAPALLGPALYRLHLGGSGAFMGVLVILSSVTIGLVAHRWRPPTDGPVPALRLYGLGVVVHLVMVLLIATLPAGLAWPTFQKVGPAILIVYPLATVLAGQILADREALRASEARFRSLFENNHAVMLLLNPANGAIEDANPAAVAYYGWTLAELRQRTAFDLNTLPRREVQRQMQAARGQRQQSFQFQHRRAQGPPRDVEIFSGPVRFGGRELLFSIVYDVTERRQAERARDESLKEKEALLKEVHHRVKNNLQVIVSLLRLEAARGARRHTAAVLAEMVGRIRSMALLHETIYRSDSLASVDLATYLRQILTQIWRAHHPLNAHVQLALDLASVRLDLDQALPCGLIVNELATNCLQHAFPAGRQGTVWIRLQPAGDSVRLEVEDDGVGLPPGFDPARLDSLGLNLVNDLCRQLGGQLEPRPRASGTGFAVEFRPRENAAPATTPLRC